MYFDLDQNHETRGDNMDPRVIPIQQQRGRVMVMVKYKLNHVAEVSMHGAEY